MMKMLLWKDWRLCRVPLIAAAILFVSPYIFMSYPLYRSSHGQLVKEFHDFGYVAWGLMLISIAALAGNIFAGERQERSADFLASFPIHRSRIIISKLLITLACVALIWIVGAAAVFIPAFFFSQSPFTIGGLLPYFDIEERETVRAFAAASVGLFGFSWLCSTLSSSSAISAAIGFGLTVAFAVASAVIIEELEPLPVATWHIVSAIVLISGILAFIAGTLHYLFRRRP